MIKRKYTHKGEFKLESGHLFTDIEICYHISEYPIDKAKPVVWVCHALTANSDAEDWWSGLVGKGKILDPDTYTIICANILGSCYGSTGALSINPATQKSWLNDFPLVTVRDWANAHEVLREHLAIERVHFLVGGSIGGFQCVEWAIMYPERIENMMLVATSYMQTPWSIAINETKRMAIETDSTFYNGTADGGKLGLAAARGVGLLSFRGYKPYNMTQWEDDDEQIENFKASSYQRYQGKKLVDRFNAHCYYALTRSQDTHNVARGRGGLKGALAKVLADTLSVGISTDGLFPPKEQQLLAKYIPNSVYREIESDFGHDGFLIENEKLTIIISEFLKDKI